MRESSVKKDSTQNTEDTSETAMQVPDARQFAALAALLDYGGDGMVAFDYRWRYTFVNQTAENILRKTASTLKGQVFWEAFPEMLGSANYYNYHKAMRERIPVEFTEFSKAAGRWFEQRCLPTSDGGVLILYHDITERQRAKEEEERREKELKNALDLMPQITWISGMDGIVTYFNRRFYDYTGIGAENESESINWFSLIHPEDLLTVERLLEWATSDAEQCEYEFRLRRHDGEYRWQQYRAVLIPSADGQTMQHVGTAVDIQARKASDEERGRREELLRETNARLEVAAFTDVLTGLANRRWLTKHLKMEWAYAIRYGLPLSLLLLDVDHFKSFNDGFGHSAGDEALLQVSYILTTSVRETDFIARLGGEEFVIVLPHTNEEESLVFGERMRTVIEEAPWSLRPITVSIGAATISPETMAPNELLSDADAAMYLAKQNRNCVRHARDIGL